jgi:sugar lactone lactonase YvrE
LRRCAPAALAAGLLAISGCSAPKAERAPVTGQYAFWPPFPAEPRLQFLVSYRYSDDVEPPTSGLDDVIFGKGRRVLPIVKPYGLDMWNGRIYVCDTKNAGVVVLDLRRQETRVMGGGGEGGLVSPTDIAITPDGTKYVTDAPRGLVQAFDAEERHVATFGFEGFRPTGIAVSGDELFVCDFESKQIVVMDRFTGDRRRDLGADLGEDERSLEWPLGIDVDPHGNVYVSDVLHCRVRRLSPSGDLVSAFGQVGDSMGSFVRPKHLAVDAEGIVYVVDAGFANVQMFDDENRLLTYFGSTGPHPGAMYLPAGICVHDGDLDLFQDFVHPAFEVRRLILVTNQFGPNKVSVYAMGGLREGMTTQDIVDSAVPVLEGLRSEDSTTPFSGARDELPPPETEIIPDGSSPPGGAGEGP